MNLNQDIRFCGSYQNTTEWLDFDDCNLNKYLLYLFVRKNIGYFILGGIIILFIILSTLRCCLKLIPKNIKLVLAIISSILFIIGLILSIDGNIKFNKEIDNLNNEVSDSLNYLKKEMDNYILINTTYNETLEEIESIADKIIYYEKMRYYGRFAEFALLLVLNFVLIIFITKIKTCGYIFGVIFFIVSILVWSIYILHNISLIVIEDIKEEMILEEKYNSFWTDYEKQYNNSIMVFCSNITLSCNNQNTMFCENYICDYDKYGDIEYIYFQENENNISIINCYDECDTDKHIEISINIYNELIILQSFKYFLEYFHPNKIIEIILKIDSIIKTEIESRINSFIIQDIIAGIPTVICMIAALLS